MHCHGSSDDAEVRPPKRRLRRDPDRHCGVECRGYGGADRGVDGPPRDHCVGASLVDRAKVVPVIDVDVQRVLDGDIDEFVRDYLNKTAAASVS